MIKEQVLIIKVKYEDEEKHPPHTWNWTDIVGGGNYVEVINHGVSEKAD